MARAPALPRFGFADTTTAITPPWALNDGLAVNDLELPHGRRLQPQSL